MPPATKPFADDDGEKKEPVLPEERMSNEELARRVKDLEASLAQTRAGMPQTLIPEHGAGVGTEVAETWSLFEQERAKRADNVLPGE